MKYIDEDLDFIFIRAKNKEGKWDSISVRELDKKQWESYLKKKFGDGKQFWNSINNIVEKEVLTGADMLGMINHLTKHGAVFVMIARGKARQDWNKN